MMKNAIEKVVVNSSFGKLATNSPEFNDKVLPEIEESFSTIVGQKGQRRPARISISGFKLREGIMIGLKAISVAPVLVSSLLVLRLS
jgi:ribosomal protein L5